MGKELNLSEYMEVLQHRAHNFVNSLHEKSGAEKEACFNIWLYEELAKIHFAISEIQEILNDHNISRKA